MKPRLLDLFCGAGGAGMGYARAGFDVVGVDIAPQPNYPFEFHQADALAFRPEGFDAIHASPPCQDHSTLNALHDEHGTAWMLSATMYRLSGQPRPFVIENVVGAPMGDFIVLCGSMFGLPVWRHRRFHVRPSSAVPLFMPACAHYAVPEPLDVTGTGSRRLGNRADGKGGNSRKPRNLGEARSALGCDWMSRRELAQAIPPAYTEFIGAQLMSAVAT